MKRGAKTTTTKLNQQIKKHATSKKKEEVFTGNFDMMVSTGSTLLDLAISGTTVRGGGIPSGILMEMFGPSSSGKTVLLSEIAGDIQRLGGEVMFNDPEARLNKRFAGLFDFDTTKTKVNEPDTVTEVFDAIKEWVPKNDAKINGIMTDSLAALSTEMELKGDDKYGMRRAKEFSEGFRVCCRLLKQRNHLMVCSNQIRDNAAMGHGENFTVPGGKAIGFYSTVRLRLYKPKKIRKEKTFNKKIIKKVIGTVGMVEVYKNSADAPFRTADLYIIFDYGVDDIRANLQYLKDYLGTNTYELNDTKLYVSLDRSIQKIEKLGKVQELKDSVIDLWEEIQKSFVIERTKKKR